MNDTTPTLAPKKDNESVTKKLMKFFKIGINKDYQKVTVSDRIRPLIQDGDKFSPEDFPPSVKKFWDYWLDRCHGSAEDYKNLVAVWEDMDLLYYNNPLIKRAIDLMTDEVVQADLDPECIGVEASKEVKNFITDFHEKISLYSLIRPIAEEVIHYGNTGLILSQNETSIEEVFQIDIYDFKSVLKFTPYEVRKFIQQKDKFWIEYSAKERIDKLIQSIVNKDNYSSYFKSYVLGYQIADFVLPPWKFLHFKNSTSKSPFNPFGIPMFIHSVAPYRQYDAAMTLQMTMRAAKLPIEKYEITASNVVDPVSKLQFVIDFLHNLQNSGFSDVRKEEKGIGEAIFTIKELFDYSMIAPDIDIGKIDDLEMLYNEQIISTGLPRNLIDPNDTGFGDSGIALIQKFKPFARQVQRIQSAILEQIVQLDKIQMIMSGKFSEDDMNFLLTMPYPESQTNSDIITSQKDLMDLVDRILELLSNRFLNGEPVPHELVRVVMNEVLPYNQEKLDRWFKIILNSKEKDLSTNAQYISNEMNEAYRKHPKKKEIMETIINEKTKTFKECCIGGKHYFSSANKNSVFRAELLNEWSIEDVKNLLHEEVKFK